MLQPHVNDLKPCAILIVRGRSRVQTVPSLPIWVGRHVIAHHASSSPHQ